MSNTTEYATGGMGLGGWLTVLFVALKLTGFIEWSWVWVLAPAWISFGVSLFILLFALAIFLAVKVRR